MPLPRREVEGWGEPEILVSDDDLSDSDNEASTKTYGIKGADMMAIFKTNLDCRVWRAWL